MRIPDEVAAKLSAETVGSMLLAELDTTEGFVRLVLGEDGLFTDINGTQWVGSKLITMGGVEGSSNGKAPAWEISCSYTVDPDREDLVSIVRGFGVDAVNGRSIKLFWQYFGKHEEMYQPIWEPVTIATRTMRRLNYSLDGPQTRVVSVTCEGPFPLRSKPVNGRYTDADQRRRGDNDPSLEFIPNNTFDEQSLFGL